MSEPIIEDCNQLIFRKRDSDRHAYSGYSEDISKAGFEGKENRWDQVKDFKWIKQEKSPSFDIVFD
jgi:hypothetical protein